MEKELEVVAIHGEGDRDTVNALQLHRNKADMDFYSRNHHEIPEALKETPDEPPDVVVILRDAAHLIRVEWPVRSWQEVEEWKKLVGYDAKNRHWKHGAKILVKLS